MNQHQRINQEIEKQYELLSDAVLISPAALAFRVQEQFLPDAVEPHIEYASLQHMKHLCRVFLRKSKDHDSDENEIYGQQGSLDFGAEFTGELQDRYPLPRKQGEEPQYKLRQHLTEEEIEWNALQLEKAGRARIAHARALRLEFSIRKVAETIAG